MWNEYMQHTGMNRESYREAMLNKLAIGQQYRLKSKREHIEKDTVRCKLTDLSRNMAVFEHKDGKKESFTYQELWSMMMEGTFA